MASIFNLFSKKKSESQSRHSVKRIDLESLEVDGHIDLRMLSTEYDFYKLVTNDFLEKAHITATFDLKCNEVISFDVVINPDVAYNDGFSVVEQTLSLMLNYIAAINPFATINFKLPSSLTNYMSVEEWVSLERILVDEWISRNHSMFPFNHTAENWVIQPPISVIGNTPLMLTDSTLAITDFLRRLFLQKKTVGNGDVLIEVCNSYLSLKAYPDELDIDQVKGADDSYVIWSMIKRA